MNHKTDIFENLIKKRTTKLRRTTVSLSDLSLNKLERLKENYEIQLHDIVSSIFKEYDKPDTDSSDSCFKSIQAEAERIHEKKTPFPNSKSISLKEEDIRTLKFISKEINLSRDVMINAIINYAEFCISQSVEEQKKILAKASKLVSKWLDDGEMISKKIATELGSSDEMVNRLQNIVNSEREFLQIYTSEQDKA